MTTPNDWVKKYAELCDSIIARKSSTMKRGSYKFPETTIHSKIVVSMTPEFCIYEHYGTCFLRGLT